MKQEATDAAHKNTPSRLGSLSSCPADPSGRRQVNCFTALTCGYAVRVLIVSCQVFLYAGTKRKGNRSNLRCKVPGAHLCARQTYNMGGLFRMFAVTSRTQEGSCCGFHQASCLLLRLPSERESHRYLAPGWMMSPSQQTHRDLSSSVKGTYL